MMKLYFKLILFLLFSSGLIAAEIDHYPFMYKNQRDSSRLINKKLNTMLKEYVSDLNNRRRKITSCSKAVITASAKLQKGVESKIGRWTRVSPKIDQRPRAINGKMGNYYDDSIYYVKGIPDAMPFGLLKKLAPIINFNGIYIGGDKIGHITDQGLDLYKIYTKARKKGKSVKVATDKGLKKGLFLEKTTLGGWFPAVISFADMEANYQGLLMYRHMCEGPRPYIGKDSKGNWILQRKIDLKNYVTPYMNEIFYPNLYLRRIRKKTINMIKEKYCNAEYFGKSKLLERQSYYLKIGKPSYAYKYLRGQINRGKLKDNTKNHIYHICKDLVSIKDFR